MFEMFIGKIKKSCQQLAVSYQCSAVPELVEGKVQCFDKLSNRKVLSSINLNKSPLWVIAYQGVYRALVDFDFVCAYRT